MEKTGAYKIETSFYIPDLAIIALCQHIEGIVRVGSVNTFEFAGLGLRQESLGLTSQA